jgi:hypothetical protein
MSSTGSSDLGDCRCAPGYTCQLTLVVHAEIRLLIVRSDFTAEMQARYIAAIAMAAGVAADKVRIVSISEVTVGTNRRLLLGYGANAVEVHTSIYGSRREGVPDLNAHLLRNGLPAHRGIRISIHKEVTSSFRLGG